MTGLTYSIQAWHSVESFERSTTPKADMKFGLVIGYPGQTTEEQFLGNNTISEEAGMFLDLIGDTVTLKGFTGFKAGLDVNTNTTGEKSLYTRYESIEIMFHVSVMLKHVETDNQHLEKKRHIGNDVCVVIFKEGDDAIDISSFVSKFNRL